MKCQTIADRIFFIIQEPSADESKTRRNRRMREMSWECWSFSSIHFRGDRNQQLMYVESEVNLIDCVDVC